MVFAIHQRTGRRYTRVPSILKPPPSSLPALSLHDVHGAPALGALPVWFKNINQLSLPPNLIFKFLLVCSVGSVHWYAFYLTLCSSLVLSNLVFNWIFHSHLDLLFSSLFRFSNQVCYSSCFGAWPMCPEDSASWLTDSANIDKHSPNLRPYSRFLLSLENNLWASIREQVWTINSFWTLSLKCLWTTRWKRYRKQLKKMSLGLKKETLGDTDLW